MSIFRNLLVGLVSALASIILVVGALSASLAEGYTPQAPVVVENTATSLPTSAPTRPLMQTPVGLTRLTPTARPSPSLPPTRQPSPTRYAPTACPRPAGWVEYTVQPGDDIADLAVRYGLSTTTLMKANCLVTQSLLAGTILSVPPRPVIVPPVIIPTATISCGTPYGWIQYIVKPGDTLFNLSLIYGVSVLELQYANCLPTSLIRVGQAIWVPNVPTRTPAASSTPAVPLLTATRTQQAPTAPPTSTPPATVAPQPSLTSVPSATLQQTVPDPLPSSLPSSPPGLSEATSPAEATPITTGEPNS